MEKSDIFLRFSEDNKVKSPIALHFRYSLLNGVISDAEYNFYFTNPTSETINTL